MARRAQEHPGSRGNNRHRHQVKSKGGPKRDTKPASLVETHRSQIIALAEKHGLRDVRVFGSMARGDANDASDVDLLVTRTPKTSGLAIFALETDVATLLGRPVDVLTEGCLHHTFRERVLREAIPL